jgi:hypothetical protein
MLSALTWLTLVAPKKQRIPGDIVWVERTEATSTDWFECKVIDIQEDPITGKAVYQVELLRGEAAGEIFGNGAWLKSDRLCDENDRRPRRA